MQKPTCTCMYGTFIAMCIRISWVPFCEPLLQFKLSRNYIWSVQSEPQKIWVLCMIFFHSKFETTGYKFGIKVVLTGTVVQSKTFLFRTDKIIKSI